LIVVQSFALYYAGPSPFDFRPAGFPCPSGTLPSPSCFDRTFFLYCLFLSPRTNDVIDFFPWRDLPPFCFRQCPSAIEGSPLFSLFFVLLRESRSYLSASDPVPSSPVGNILLVPPAVPVLFFFGWAPTPAAHVFPLSAPSRPGPSRRFLKVPRPPASQPCSRLQLGPRGLSFGKSLNFRPIIKGFAYIIQYELLWPFS